MSTWRVAEAIKTLQGEVNSRYPGRPKQADGTIGDARHQAEQSDHNPNPPHAGVVTAWDITTAPFTIDLAEQLRLLGKGGDQRVKYVIYRGRITSAQHGWQWVPYSGYSQHFDHIHLSVSDDPRFYDSTDPWDVFGNIHASAHTDPQPLPTLEPNMVVLYAPGKPLALLAAGKLTALQSNAEKDALVSAGIPFKKITAEEFSLIQTVAAR
jgi:hypothetical protein